MNKDDDKSILDYHISDEALRDAEKLASRMTGKDVRFKRLAITMCKHCGLPISGSGHAWVHEAGVHRGKQRCGPESGLPYGYNADPEGKDCGPICLGYEDKENS